MNYSVNVPASICLAVVFLLYGGAVNGQSPQQKTTDSPPAPPRVKKDRPARELPLKPTVLANLLGVKTAEDYPYIDGSTSALPLVQGIYRQMFAVPLFGKNTNNRFGFPREVSKTVPAYEKLIAGEVDLIFGPDPSEDIKQLAADAGVELEWVQIGADALVFITSGKNPVKGITTEQIVNIYSDGSITNWADLGGKDGRLVALVRNKDSGSHGQLENLVLKGKPVHPGFQEHNARRVIRGMSSILMGVDGYDGTVEAGAENDYTLGYTVFYYLQAQQRERQKDRQKPLDIKTLAVDGVTPMPETIASGEYKLAIGCYAIIRKDEPADSPTRKMVAWLTSDKGQQTVKNAGLGTVKPVTEKASKK